MKDSLSYRVADEGEIAFNQAVASAKKWINANVNGPVKLGFSIALKLSVPEGESIQAVLATEPMFKNGDSTVCKACKARHHDRCTREDCACPSTTHAENLSPADRRNKALTEGEQA